jgi:hypothetical protein
MDNKWKELFTILSEAPDSQIDPSVTPRLKALAESDDVASDDLLKILDDCAYASLASGFAMAAMDIVWQDMLASEGRSADQVLTERMQKVISTEEELIEHVNSLPRNDNVISEPSTLSVTRVEDDSK